MLVCYRLIFSLLDYSIVKLLCIFMNAGITYFLKDFIFVFIHIYLCVSVWSIPCVPVSKKMPEDGIRSPGARFTGWCELLIQVLGAEFRFFGRTATTLKS